MKQLSIALVLVLGLVASAMADTQTYETKVSNFTIDVPDGWKGKAIPDGCAVESADGANAITVQFFPTNAMSAMDAAKMMAKSAQMNITSEKSEGGAVFLDGDKNGTPMGVLMVKTEKVLMAVLLAGKDRETMMQIYNTIKSK
ncbi:MAG: hypothetical protein IJU65_03265 [Desulfovibrio sp.]|nr:hypothetical protein [Desulfovibrio sp.]